MKILLANKFYYPRGGDCIHTIELQKLLEQHGHRVAIFSMQYPENLPSEYSDYWPSGIDFTSLNINRLKESILRPVLSSEVKKKWNRLLDDFKPDIVHLQNIHSQLSPVIAQEASKRGIPVYWTLHDYKLICPAYTFLRNGSVCEDCLTDKRSVIRHRCIKGSLPGSVIGYLEAARWSRERLEGFTTKFVAPSKFLRNKMIEAGFESGRIVHIYNFADKEKFSPVSEKEDYALFLGRLSKEKGVETLLKAARSLPDFQLKIVGDGPERERLVQGYAAPNIEFLGHQNWETIKRLLGSARFMIIPSEWYENNPLSVIEALAMGTPVLGADIGGIPELIRPENGRLFQSGNVQDLIESIKEMMGIDSWRYQEIASAAQETFSADKYYGAIEELYGWAGRAMAKAS